MMGEALLQGQEAQTLNLGSLCNQNRKEPFHGVYVLKCLKLRFRKRRQFAQCHKKTEDRRMDNKHRYADLHQST